MTRTLKLLPALALFGACASPPPATPAAAPLALTAAADDARTALPAVGDDPRVAGVLQGLRPRVEFEGRPPVRWTLEERMAIHEVPGVSIAVIENGRIAWAQGAGVREAGSAEPVTPATLFQAASISKPVAATAMLRLVERGTLDLDADVNGYLTSWQVPANGFTRAEAVTLRRIASHSAGLTVHGFRGYAAGEAVPTALQVLKGEAPANSAPVVVDIVPGSAVRYSGGGTTVMQQLLEDVTGVPFAELMHRLVLGPAGMRSSTYQQPLPAARGHEAARGHDRRGAPVPGGWHVYPEQAAAGLWTTASDLAAWAIAIADARAGRSGTLLSQEMARQMLTPQLDGAAIGLPVSGSGEAFRFSHTGSNVGFRAQLMMFPERGAGVVVMTNGDGGSPLSDEIVRAVAAEYGWPDLAPQRITPVPLDPALAAAVAGRYILQVGPGQPVEVRLEEGRLMLDGPPGMVQELVPESETGFVSSVMGWRVEFARDDAGRAVGIRVLPGPGSRPVEGARAP